MRGFTLLELVIAVAILLAVLVISLPLYRKNLRERGVESGARFLEAEYLAGKQRAVALGTDAGLCLNRNQVLAYELHPFFPGSAVVTVKANLGTDFGVPVSATLVSTGAPAGANPCPSGSTVLQLSPYPDSSRDWQGTITLESGGAEWQVQISGGLITDAPR